MKKTSKRTAGSPKPLRARAPVRKTRRLPVEAVLVAFADLAKRLGIRWYVFGAQAVNLYGFPRATADLDLTIELSAVTTEDLLAALVAAGFDPRFTDPAFIAATRVIPVVHRATKLPVDLVLAGPGLEERFLDEVELHRVGGRRIPVLSAENLVVTKLLAGRPKDLEDVRELVAMRGTELDVARIEELLEILEAALDQHDLIDRFSQLR